MGYPLRYGAGSGSECQAVFHANDVLVPDISGESAAVANVEVAERAEERADTELRIDDCLAGRALGSRERKGAFPSAQYSPAHEFSDGRNLDLRSLIDLVTEARSIAEDVAGKVGAADRNPIAKLALKC